MMKGALVELKSGLGAPLPNVVVFQFNPETLRHSLSQPQPATTQAGQTGSNPLAIPGVPAETFSFTLSLDASDHLSNPNDPGLALAAKGVYARLAALEMLLFPVDNGPSSAPTGESRQTPSAQAPAVIFVWGPGRVVPVRVTSLTVTEKLYDVDLNPIYAEAAVELKVLTPAELDAVTDPLLRGAAKAAYCYTQGLRQGLAIANLGDEAKAAIGILRDAVPRPPPNL